MSVMPSSGLVLQVLPTPRNPISHEPAVPSVRGDSKGSGAYSGGDGNTTSLLLGSLVYTTEPRDQFRMRIKDVTSEGLPIWE